MSTTPAVPRYHALDALRGIMMLSGVVIHALCPYSTLPDIWWLKDREQSAYGELPVIVARCVRPALNTRRCWLLRPAHGALPKKPGPWTRRSS